MALPVSRNTNYAGMSQVKSADVNALQDGQISLFGPRKFKSFPVYAEDASGTPVATFPVIPRGTAPYKCYCPMPELRSGDRLTVVHGFVDQTNGANVATVAVYAMDMTEATGTAGLGILLATATGPGSTGNKNINPTAGGAGLPYTVPDSFYCYAIVTLTHANDKCLGVEYTIDRITL